MSHLNLSIVRFGEVIGEFERIKTSWNLTIQPSYSCFMFITPLAESTVGMGSCSKDVMHMCMKETRNVAKEIRSSQT